jgi:hypothetical protein
MRTAPQSGPSSSDAWNDSFTEIATDLANISQEWNNKIVVIIDSLPKGVLDSAVNVFQNGLDAQSMWVDQNVESSDDDLTYYDASKDRPVTVKEALDGLYSYIDTQDEQVRTDVADSTAGLTSEQEDRIGANVFDATQTSSTSSLDGKSELNRLNIIQLARDIYGSGYQLGNNGLAKLTNNSVYEMVDALLELHNGNWDDDVTLDHVGAFSATQGDINSSHPGDDTYTGSPTDLEEDLDRIRNAIKTLKGTAGWLTAHSALYAGGADSLEELLSSTSGSTTKSASNPWGYQYDDVAGLNTRLDAIKTFTGQDSQTDTTPSYSSTAYVANADPLETAVGKLDAGLNTEATVISGHAQQLAALEIFTGQDNNTDSTPSYSSTAYVADDDPLETAIGKLDAGLATVSGTNQAFTELTDTPGNYTGEANKVYRVNSGETGLETVQTTISGNGYVDTPGNVTASGDIETGNSVTAVFDVEVTDSGHGLVIKSPDGTRYRVMVDNAGTLYTTAA